MKRFAFFGWPGCSPDRLREPASHGHVQPTVSVSNFKSLSFSPQRIEFDATVLIQNNAPVELDVQKVDWAVDMYDQQLFTDSLTGLNQTNANGSRTISLPFHIAMKDVMAQAPDLLAEGRLKVTFAARYSPPRVMGWSPCPSLRHWRSRSSSCLTSRYVGSDGEPFSDAFRLNFKVTNTNDFPFHADVRQDFPCDKRKEILPAAHARSVDIPPGQTLPVALQMENSPGKTLSMALNLAQHPNPSFSVNGTATFKTPYGFIYIPLSLEEILQ